MALNAGMLRLAQAYGPRALAVLQRLGPVLLNRPETQRVLQRVLGPESRAPLSNVVSPVARLERSIARLRSSLVEYHDAATSAADREQLADFITRADRLESVLPLAKVGALAARRSVTTGIRNRLDDLLAEVLVFLLPPTG